MAQEAIGNRLDRPVDDASDHILGPANAEITLVEYGSYACPHCRAANDRIAEIRDQFGDRLRYVFRHRPLTDSDIALRAAELAERVDFDRFWDAHVELMTRSPELTEDDLRAVAEHFGVEEGKSREAKETTHRAHERVDADRRSARASGVMITPTFFINGRRYDGPWDESSFLDAMLGSLGHRVRSAALDFASWAPSTGVLLLLASILAVVLMNSGFGAELRRVLGNLRRVHDRRRQLPDVAAALGQRRPVVGLLPGGRPGDQARVHRRPSRQPALGGAADRRRHRRHGGASAALCPDHSRADRGRMAGACRWRPTRRSRSR